MTGLIKTRSWDPESGSNQNYIRRRKPPNPWVMQWIHQRQEKGCYSNLLADLIETDILGYQNFVRMPPAFLTSSRNIYTTTSRSQSLVFRKPLEVEVKLAITLRHLATGETYTSLQSLRLVGCTTVCKFDPGMLSHPY